MLMQWRCPRAVVLGVLMFLVVQCAPPGGEAAPAFDQEGDGVRQGMTETTGITNPEAGPMPETAVTVPAEESTRADEPGQTDSGEATGARTEIGGTTEVSRPGDWQTYIDEIYRFRLAYPARYQPVLPDVQIGANPGPMPKRIVAFRDSGHPLESLAPPVLEIQVFETAPDPTLESWLIANGLFNREAGWITEPYEVNGLSGLKVVSSAYMAPGWSVYLVGGPYIYRLTPLDAEGERILQTFTRLP